MPSRLENKVLSVPRNYFYTATDSTCSLSGCQMDILHGGIVEYTDVSIDSEHAVTSAVTQQPVSIAIEANQSLSQSYSSGMLNATCGTKLDHSVLAVGYGTDACSDHRKV